LTLSEFTCMVMVKLNKYGGKYRVFAQNQLDLSVCDWFDGWLRFPEN